ncbi:MAG: CARDB domain-containing protein [Candidatus Thalassarchaeaceae archaeon]|nr:CARDB domain-containing protein [Candidatus Thalassarchaeaceae archaeon]
MIVPSGSRSGRNECFLALLLTLLMLLQSQPLTHISSEMEEVAEPLFSGGGPEAWSDGGEAWPQFGRFPSHNATAPEHGTNGGPGSGSVANVTLLMTVEDPEVNWQHFSTSSYGAQGLASVVGDFTNNIVITGNANERCGAGHLFTALVSERESGGSTHSFLSIIEGDTSRKAWEVDLGVTDSVKAAPAIIDVDDDGILEILVAYDAQGTFNTELWSPTIQCGEAGWNSGGSHTTELLWSYTDPDLGITVPSPYILANHQVGTQILLGDLDLDGTSEAIYSLVNEGNEQVVVLALPLPAGGVPTPIWQVNLDHGEIPSDPAWVKIDDTNSAVLLTTIDPDDGNLWVWRLDGTNGAPNWGGVTLNNLDGNTDSPHIRLPGPVVAELDGTPGAEMVITIPTDIDGGSSGDGAEYVGMEVNDASELWSFRATNGFGEAPPDVFDSDDDGIDDRVCWVTWYRVDTDRKGVAGCHDVTAALGPSLEFSHTMDRSSGNPNDEIGTSPPFHLDLDGQGAPETLLAFGRTLWAWDGDSGTQAGVGMGWTDELALPHRTWAAPALADLDGDGALDILIGDTLVSRAASDVRPFVDGRGVQFTPSQPDPGETFTATAYIENVGTESTGESVDAALYYDGVKVYGELIAEMEPVAPTGNGNFATFSYDLIATLGSHTAKIVVDPHSNLTQARYDNDEQTVELVIVEPYDVSIGMPVDPPRVDPGFSKDVDITVSSTGRLSGIWSMSIDSTNLPSNWTVQDITNGGSSSIEIQAEQPWTATLRITAPTEALGSDAGHLSITMTLDEDANVTVSSILPVEANRTRGLSVRGPSGTSDTTGYGIPGSSASAWLLVENLGNAEETVSNRAWDPTSWGNNLTLHDASGELPMITLAPGEQLELHAKLPVPGGTTLGDTVSSTMTICIGTGEEEVCRSIDITFVANGVSVSPDNMRTVPASQLSWNIDGSLPANIDNLSWDLQTSGMLISGWNWQTGGDCVLDGSLLSCHGPEGGTFSGSLTLDQPVDAPPQFHPFSVNASNQSGYKIDFSIQVLQVFRSDISIISPTESPLLMNVSQATWIVLRLENPGNGPDNYDLTARMVPNENFTDDPGIVFNIPSPNYSINAAGLRQVPVQVTLPLDTPARQGMKIEFSLRSQGDDSVYDLVLMDVEARQDHRWNVSLLNGAASLPSGEGVFTAPGTATTLTLSVTNIGNFDDTLDVSSSLTLSLIGNDTQTDWEISGGSSGILDVNQSTTIVIDLDVPELAWNGTIAHVQFALSSDGLQLQLFTVDVEVNQLPLWIVRATGSDLDVEPDGSNITLELEQRGNYPSRAYLSAAINAAGWNLSAPNDLPTLDPGQSVSISIFVKPPAGAISGPSVEMMIVARNGDGRGEGTTILPVRVKPAYDFSTTIPANWEGWLVSDSGGMPRVTIANTGNAPNQLHIELLGLPLGWGPSETNVSLAWGEQKGVPIDLIPDSGWDHSNIPIQIRVTDAGGKVITSDANITYSVISWASSPVMWGALGDDKIVQFHGSAINSVSSAGTQLEATQNGWILPSPNGEGTLIASSTQGDVTLAYSAHMQVATTRPVSCTLDSNLSAQPLVTCAIANGTEPFTWSIILRSADGGLISQLDGTTSAGTSDYANLSASGWSPAIGIHELTLLVFSSEGKLQTSESQQYIVRASGWNIGVGIEETNSGDLNVLIDRENFQIMEEPNCRVELNQGTWSKTIAVDITATLAPKLSVARPSGDQSIPVNATFSCQAPWDIDDNPSDNTAEIVLSNQPEILPIDSTATYSIATALLIIAVLWLLGVIKPRRASHAPVQRKTVVKGSKRETSPQRKTATPKPKQEESTTRLEEDITAPEPEASDEDITEMQESLIEVEDSEPEPLDEELDEFELRLRKLRERSG